MCIDTHDSQPVETPSGRYKYRRWKRNGVIGLLAGIALVAFAPSGHAQENDALAKIPPLTKRVTMRVASAPSNIFPLPILYAKEKGYFDKVGLDVQIIKYTQAAAGLAPMLARGDLEIAPQAPSPSFFNLLAEGFGAKAVSVMASVKPGRTELAWLAVAPDKANEIKDYSDLKGKVVEGASIGSTASFIVQAAIQRAGLTPGKDLTLLAKARSNADFLALAKAKAQDVLGVIEPMASRAEKEGYVVRWKGLSEVAPGYQSVLMATSEQFLRDQPVALRTFIAAYLVACREINATEGQWRPDLLKIMAQWTDLDPAIITEMGGIPYFEPNGDVSMPSLDFAQRVWLKSGVLKQQADINALVDAAPAADAAKLIGRVN